jgi:hypothetical protein
MAANVQAFVDGQIAAAVKAAVDPLNGKIAQQDATIADLKARLAAATAPAPAPTPIPAPTPAPSTLKGWQLNETNTGLARLGIDRNSLPLYTGPNVLPAGTTLTMVRIEHPELICCKGNITLDRCYIRPNGGSQRSSIVYGLNPDTGGNQLGDVIIKDCDIDGTAITWASVYGQCAFRGAGTLLRNHIWGMGTGIAYFGDSSVTASLIEHNYVHGLRSGIGLDGQMSHGEAATVRRFAGTSLIWRNNRLQSDMQANSGAMFIAADGPTNHALLQGNLIASTVSGHTLVLAASSGGYGTDMQAIDNRFTFCGIAGYGNYVDGGPGWAQWVDNYVYAANATDCRGAAVAKP